MMYKVIEIVDSSLHGNPVVVSALKKNDDCYIALVCRQDNPAHRAYSTHEVNVTNGCMYYGHYDMSYARAVNDMYERTGKKLNAAFM